MNREHWARSVVLIADDEEVICFCLAREARRLGALPVVASDGLEALTQFHARGGAVDAVILDVRMPNLDGPATLAAMRDHRPGLHACFMSAFENESSVRSFGDTVSFLSKPFDLDAFGQVLERLLGTDGTGAFPAAVASAGVGTTTTGCQPELSRL